jgi:hypothetical protein
MFSNVTLSLLGKELYFSVLMMAVNSKSVLRGEYTHENTFDPKFPPELAYTNSF